MDRDRQIASQLGKLARWALMEELVTTPKPGLVDSYSNGAHRDMNFQTFEKSAEVLEPYYCRMAEAAQQGEEPEQVFREIRNIGIKAEKAMFTATQGANTHKGLIFSLGILCSGAAILFKDQSVPLTEEGLFAMEQRMVSTPLRQELERLCRNEAQQAGERTHGEQVLARYGAKGVRGEALSGYPSVRALALPVMAAGIKEGRDWNTVKLQTLCTLMSQVEDSNILSRRDEPTLSRVQDTFRKFLGEGGAYQKDGEQKLKELDARFIRENISPGGSADLLAVTIFVTRLLSEYTVFPLAAAQGEGKLN